MSAGDITRLSRMYHCPNFEASITLNDPTTKQQQQQSTQFPNGVNIDSAKVTLFKHIFYHEKSKGYFVKIFYSYRRTKQALKFFDLQ
jgi:hypothetical protein